MSVPALAYVMKGESVLVKPFNKSGVEGKAFSFAVKRENLVIVRNQLFSPNSYINSEATDIALKTFNEMLPGQRTCYLSIAITKPITRAQADAINDRNGKIADGMAQIIGGASGAVAGFFSGIYLTPASVGKTTTLVGATVGYSVNQVVKKNLPTMHAGDVIFLINAEVSGGIGPQSRSRMEIFRRANYDPNPLMSAS